MNFQEYLDGSFGAFRNYHPFEKTKNGFINIPEEYLELFVDSFEDVDKIPYSKENVNLLIQLYISSFWLDQWYSSEIDFTPRTTFYDWDYEGKDEVWSDGKFARLNSVSAKGNEPLKVYSLSEAKSALSASARCQNVMEVCRNLDLPIQIAIRDFVDLSEGNEYRVFIYRDQVTAICSNDYKIPNVNETQLVERVKMLWKRALNHLPFQNCIMDIFISDHKVNADLVIEFNSFGKWANGAAGLFSWFEDHVDLHSHDPISIKMNE